MSIKIEMMSDFDQKFIDDPLFLKWIFNNRPAVEKHWNDYLLAHPEEKEKILELKEQVSKLQFSNDTLLISEKRDLSNSIHNQLFGKDKKTGSVLMAFMRYAAVAIIFAALGGLMVYLNTGKESVYQQLAGQLVEIPSSGHGPVLITSNGENVNLKKSNSSVDYTRRGTIVINKDSVINTNTASDEGMNQLVIPYGNQSQITLADNTVVWLNAGSRLIYPGSFKGKTREVLLFGEAFFEVSENKEQPFVVKTTDLQIKVLGTKFNVSAYAEDKIIQTVLAEGSVSVRKNDANFYDRDLILKPNQLASFNKTSAETKIYDVDAAYYTLWTKGLLSFNEVDFNRILKKVERFYNVTISFSEPTLGLIRISGKLDLKQHREEVLEYLEKVSLTKIEKVDDFTYVVKK
jgi:hypothetical protein